MSVKKLLLVTASLLCAHTITYAKIPPEQCAAECKQVFCNNIHTRSQCEIDCPGTCGSSVAQPPAQSDGQQPTPSASVQAGQGNVGQSTKNVAPQPKPPVRSPVSASANPSSSIDRQTPQDALFLEKISDSLLKITKQNCDALITQTYSKIKNIPSQPQHYTDQYKSAKDYEPIMEQIQQSFQDLKDRVKKMILKAKDPNNKEDMIKIFRNIYGDIDLNSRKNCEKYTSMMNEELDNQFNKIFIFNNKKSSITQRIKNKFDRN